MAQDHFLEEVVVRYKKGLSEALYFLSWLLIVMTGIMAIIGLNLVTMSLGAGTGFDWFSLIFTLLCGGIAVYTFFFHDRLRTEYEYTFTNGALDFAEVYNNKKRKSLGSLNVRTVDAFGPVNSNAFQRYLNTPGMKRMNWFLNREAELYYFVFSKDSVKKMIILEPSEEMVKCIKTYLPYGIWQD